MFLRRTICAKSLEIFDVSALILHLYDGQIVLIAFLTWEPFHDPRNVRSHRHLTGNRRWIYVVTAIAALYLNVFVLVVQAFQKVEPLKALAPTQADPPFVIAQGIVLLLYIALGFVAVRKFHPGGWRATA
jgi:hypothetical protein